MRNRELASRALKLMTVVVWVWTMPHSQAEEKFAFPAGFCPEISRILGTASRACLSQVSEESSRTLELYCSEKTIASNKRLSIFDYSHLAVLLNQFAIQSDCQKNFGNTDTRHLTTIRDRMMWFASEVNQHQLQEFLEGGKTPDPVPPGHQFRTSTGFTFVHLISGEGWKTPDGTVWSELQGRFENSGGKVKYAFLFETPATQACIDAHGFLPIRQDITELLKYFEWNENRTRLSNQGQSDLLTLFPELQKTTDGLWTAEIGEESDEHAHLLNGLGEFKEISRDHDNSQFTRCILEVRSNTDERR